MRILLDSLRVGRWAPVILALALGCGASHEASNVDAAASDADAADASAHRADADAADASAHRADASLEDPRCLPPTSMDAFDAFLERAVRAICERAMRCGEHWIDYASVDACVRFDAAAWDRAWWERYRMAIADGRFAVDPAQVDACLDIVLACDPPPQVYRVTPGRFAERGPRPCREVVRPRCPIARGEECPERHLALGCDEGLVCGGDACPPTCVPRSPLGARCEYFEECAPSPDHAWVWCAPTGADDEGGVCEGLHDEPGAGPGAPCGRVGEERLATCAPGHECRAPVDVPPTCSARLESGAPCWTSWSLLSPSRCPPGDYCDPESNACAPRAEAHRPVLIGAPCEPGDTCDTQHRSECIDGVCTTIGGEGEPCDGPRWESVALTRCDPGLYCVGEVHGEERCTRTSPYVQNGEACALHEDCESWCCNDEHRCEAWDWCPDSCPD